MCTAAFDYDDDDDYVVDYDDYDYDYDDDDDDKASVRPGVVKHCAVTSFRLHYIRRKLVFEG